MASRKVVSLDSKDPAARDRMRLAGLDSEDPAGMRLGSEIPVLDLVCMGWRLVRETLWVGSTEGEEDIRKTH